MPPCGCSSGCSNTRHPADDLHDRDFIDGTCERILQIEQQQLQAYKGNYSDFERQRAERLANQQASYEKQQRRIAEIDDFVRRFRYKATKARQAQSRLRNSSVCRRWHPPISTHLLISVFRPARSSDPLLRLDGASLGYGGPAVLAGVELHLRPGSRYGLLGKNGAGKSTLLKAWWATCPCWPGTYRRRSTAPSATSISSNWKRWTCRPARLHLQRLSPDARSRRFLTSWGLHPRGDTATSVIAPFPAARKPGTGHGGMAAPSTCWCWTSPPTTSTWMRHALEVALGAYEGRPDPGQPRPPPVAQYGGRVAAGSRRPGGNLRR